MSPKKVIFWLIVIFVLIPKNGYNQDILPNGYCLPVLKSYYDNSKNNFALAGDEYISGYRHLGWDIICPLNSVVYSIADGEIVASSPGGWDQSGEDNNYALIVRYISKSGEVFYAIYGHLIRPVSKTDGKPISDDEIRNYRGVNSGGGVKAGEIIGHIGKWKPPHLHFGIYYNRDSILEFPTTDLGRVILPGPTISPFKGIMSCGNWRSPKEWLESYSVISKYIENYLPVCTDDRIYFIHKDIQNHYFVAELDPMSTKKTLIWQLQDGVVPVGMFNGPNNSLFIKAHFQDFYTLLQCTPGVGGKALFSARFDFNVANFRKGYNFLPILQSVTGWEIFDLTDQSIKPRTSVMKGDKKPNSDWASLFVPVEEDRWRVLGSITDAYIGDILVSWTMNAKEQNRYIIQKQPEGENSDLLVMENSDLSLPLNAENVIFHNKKNGMYSIIEARLNPKDDPFTQGFYLSDLRTVFSNTKLIHPTSVGNILGTETVLGTAEFESGREICSIELKTGNYRLLTDEK